MFWDFVQMLFPMNGRDLVDLPSPAKQYALFYPIPPFFLEN